MYNSLHYYKWDFYVKEERVKIWLNIKKTM